MNVSQLMSEQSDSQGPNRQDSLMREKMLQQVVLDQKQRIKLLEQKLNTQDNSNTSVVSMKFQNEIKIKNQQMQQLYEKLDEQESSIVKSKEYVMELLQQREQDALSNKQSSDYKVRELEQEVYGYRQECEHRVSELEQENDLLRSERGKSMTLSKALDNYTTEEQYLKQIRELQGFLACVENEYMAEIVHYKRGAESTRQFYEKVQTLSEDEKRILRGKLDEMKEVDVKVEKEVLEKFSELQLEIKRISNDLQKRNQEIGELKKYNIEEIQSVLDEKFQGEHLWLREKHELQHQLKQMQLSQDVRMAACEREVQGSSHLKIIEVEKHIRENSVLMKEKETLQQALQDMKELALGREAHLRQEIERYRRQTTTLMEASKNRECILEDEIKKLNFSVFQLHKAFESRESLFMGQSQITRNWDELIHNIIQKYEQINLDLRVKLDGKRGGDTIKELKFMLTKLVEKYNETDKQKNIVFEKQQVSQKGMSIDRQLDRFVYLCQEYSSKLEILLDRAKAMGLSRDEPPQQNTTTTPRKVQQGSDNDLLKQLVIGTQSALKVELDVTQYEQMLMMKDAEILLAKQNLIQFASHYRNLEEKLNEKLSYAEQELQKQAYMSIEQQEEMLLTRLNIERQKMELQLLNQKKDIQQLQTEKQISMEMRQRYEQHFNQEVRRIETQLNQKSDELKKMIINEKSLTPRKQQPSQRNLPPQQNLNTSLSSTNSLNLKQDSLNKIKQKDLHVQFQSLNDSSAELKQILQDVEKNYLNNQRVQALIKDNAILQTRLDELNQLNNHNYGYCKEHLQKLESMYQHPNRAFEESFLTFKKEIESLVSLRQSVEDAVHNRATFFQKLEENYLALFEFTDGTNNNPLQAKIQGTLQNQQHQDAITMLQQEVNMQKESHQKERECHQKELNVAVENLQSMLSIYEKKVDNSTSEAASLRRLVDDTKQNNQILILQYQKDVKALKNEVQSITKIVSEAQQKRLEERKRYLANIHQIEQKVVAKQEQSIQHLEKKIKQIGLEFEKKARILQQRTNLQHHEGIIDTKVDELKDKQFRQQIISMNEELQILRERDTERDQIISKQFKQIQVLLETLQKSIDNLHGEKSRLIEEVDYLTQLLGIKDKEKTTNRLNTYSFRV